MIYPPEFPPNKGNPAEEQVKLVKDSWLHLVKDEGIGHDRILLMINTRSEDS